MSRFAKLFAANAIGSPLGTAVGIAGLSCAALALSASAAAEPAPPPAIPGVPALSMLQQFATNPASMGAVLQARRPRSTVRRPCRRTGRLDPAGLPDRGGSRLRRCPTRPQGCRSAPAPALVPLLNQLGVPASLANLAPADLPLQIGDTLGIAPAPVAAPVTGPLTTPPVSTIPLLPVPPVGSTGQMPLLNALP